MTSPITDLEVVSLALYQLDGASRVVDTEDVAVRAHEVAPHRFGWRKFPEQINLELVRVALSDAKKDKNGALVNGTGASGWSLTAAGLRWAESNARRLSSRDMRKQRAERTAGSIDERRWQRERARLLSSDAWREWSVSRQASALTTQAAEDLFRIDRYVDGRGRELKVNRLRQMFSSDDELEPFVDAVASIVLKE